MPAAMPAALPALFPTKVRYGSLFIGFNASVSLRDALNRNPVERRARVD